VTDLEDKTVLVTGASSGLGRHFAARLAAEGARVVAAARRTDRLADLVAEIAGAGGRAAAVALDVTDAASVAQAFDGAEAAFGPVSVLINNAGVAGGKAALELTEADWDAVMDTNLKGAWAVATEAARRMEATGGGAIVNIASIYGFGVGRGVLPYAVSKAGVVQMTKAMALEWARYGIRVNALAPGFIETDLNRDFLASDAGQALKKRIPQRRFGAPADLDGPLLLLAGEGSRFMTGSVVTVDGGHRVAEL
jgi:NAD(P)-dependent dehydrogenase (short-subunit alcohol dehydrogenase family)